MPDILPVSLQNFMYSRKSKLRKQIVIENLINDRLEKKGRFATAPSFVREPYFNGLVFCMAEMSG